MDACDFVDGVKPEDNATILKPRSFKCVAKAFRIVEFCFLLLLLCWISTRLPFAVRISGQYFRQLVGVILSPVFVFILCNFIVLTLLWKYRRHSGDDVMFRNVAGAEVLYNSFLDNAEFSADFSSGSSSLETVYEDKQTIFEEPETVSNKALMKPKVPRRTQSEKMNKENAEEISFKLRRSETDKCRKITNSDDVLTEMDKCRKETNSGDTELEKFLKVTNSGYISPEKCRKVTNSSDISPSPAYEVDELSNEEFQKTIENFIAKQTKFHQQEKLVIVKVLHSQA